MKAMILAAGLGTRLRPYTEHTPKALIRIDDKPLLEIVIEKLMQFGFDQIIVNVHHHADQIQHFLRRSRYKDNVEISDERAQLLDTGGGIKKASWFLDGIEAFLVHNVDILSTVDLSKLYAFHQKSQALATLAVKNRKTKRYLLFDDTMQLSGRLNVQSSNKIRIQDEAKKMYKQLAFSGIHVISPVIFDLLRGEDRFSIIDEYLRLAENYKIIGYRHDNAMWMDIGKSEQLEQLNSNNEKSKNE